MAKRREGSAIVCNTFMYYGGLKVDPDNRTVFFMSSAILTSSVPTHLWQVQFLSLTSSVLFCVVKCWEKFVVNYNIKICLKLMLEFYFEEFIFILFYTFFHKFLCTKKF